MRRHPNPPRPRSREPSAVRAARGVDSASRRDARLLPRAGTDLSAPPSTRTSARPNPTPRPPDPARGSVPSRRPTGDVTVDAREAVRGWTDEPTAERVRGAGRDSPRASATLHPRRSPRASRNPDRRGPSRSGHPTRSSRTEGLHTAPKEKDCLSHICRPILLASSCASPCASPSALGSHARGSSRSSRSSRSGPRWGRAATPANQCFKATSAVVPKESIRRASVAAALGVCAKPYSCHSCHASCRGCDGGGSDDCTTCDDGKYESSGQCLLSSDYTTQSRREPCA